MSLSLRKATYPFRPIGSLDRLAVSLRVDKGALERIALDAGQMYRTVKPKPGSTRQTFDANEVLKPIHARIKSSILEHVDFPDYLTGSLKGRDYKKNAEIHSGQAVIICEDVKGFFNAVSDLRVYDIWRHFFHFAPPVAHTLTLLTTKSGFLPQGAIPSSYLANLALWRDEPLLQAKLEARGIRYSRYVDDIVMSSRTSLTSQEKTELIASVYGMLRKNGLSARRDKHEVYPATRRMITTKLVTNRKPALPLERRSNARAAVFQAELLALNPAASSLDVLTAVEKAANRIGQLARFHPNLAAPLKARLAVVRESLGRPDPKVDDSSPA